MVPLAVAPLNNSRMPPLDTVVLFAVPYSPTSSKLPLPIVVPVVVPLAANPTNCVPPLRIVPLAVALVPGVNPISCAPPVKIVVLTAVPPESTCCAPSNATVAPLAKP